MVTRVYGSDESGRGSGLAGAAGRNKRSGPAAAASTPKTRWTGMKVRGAKHQQAASVGVDGNAFGNKKCSGPQVWRSNAFRKPVCGLAGVLGRDGVEVST